MKKIVIFLFLIGTINNLYCQIPVVEDLRETGPNQRRDLSIPFSRIVLNPFNFRAKPPTTQSEISNRASLPLNIGYLSTERTNKRRMDDALLLYSYNKSAVTPKIDIGWTADLTNTKKWITEYETKINVQGQSLIYSVNSDAKPEYKLLRPAEKISVDLEKTPVLNIYISEASKQWSLKVSNSNNEEVTLHVDATGDGVFEYDLKKLTGWSGKQEIGLDIWCIGKNSNIKINSIRFLGAATSLPGAEASDYTTEWLPNELPFKAQYADGTRLSGTDYFYDKNTLIRKIKFDKKRNNNSFIIGGSYSGSNVSIKDNTLIIDNGYFLTAIRIKDIKLSDVKFYKSLLELRYQTNACKTPEEGFYWAVSFDINKLPDSELVTSVAFSYKNDKEDSAVLLSRVKAPFYKNDFNDKYGEVKQYWNDFLKKVPYPSDFTLRTVDSKGVTPGQIKETYYKAWIHVASDVLEADPSIYAYPQVVAGKASMWDESDDRAPYSATWESFFGIQFYAFIDPATAWDAFTGIMSLTDEEGVIGGESLPSRKSQTAWILYQITKDKKKLLEVYDALERYLNWRLVYPHWIYNSTADKRKKDAEFVFSALIDIDYMVKISREVKDLQAAEEWENKKGTFYKECLPWFWKTPESLPVQYYDTETGERSTGHAYWVTTGLHSDLINGKYLDSMYHLFSSNFNTDKSFGGMGMGAPKYPDISYTLYGLLDKGHIREAEKVMEVCIRDVVRTSSWFAESYVSSDTPYPEGVRPSLFGASIIIDFVMIKNGFRYDNGIPTIQNAFSGKRFLKGVHYGDKVLNIECEDKGLFKASGSYLKKPQEINTNYGEYKSIIN